MKKISYIHAGLIAASLLFVWGCGESTNEQQLKALQDAEETRQVSAADQGPEVPTQTEKDLQAATEEFQGKEIVEADKTKTDDKNARAEVDDAITAARVALKDARQLLTKAPTGKDAEPALQAMGNDIRSAELTLAEVPRELEPKDYITVKDQAKRVKDVATRVREQIIHAMSKADSQRP